jgi:ribokinase
VKQRLSQPPQIVVVGSHAPGLFLRVHRPPLAGETLIGWDFHEPVDGGKGSNQAIAAARLGMRTSFVGCVGKDHLGDEVERWFEQEGIDSHYLYRSDKTGTGAGFILLDDEGVPAMVTAMGANEELDENQVRKALDGLAGARVLLTQFEIQPKIALYAARLARSKGIFTIVNPAPAAEISLPDFSVSNVLVPNETEALLLMGLEPDTIFSPEQLVEELQTKSGAECVIITLGEKGIVGADTNGVWMFQTPLVKTVDTSGAGDMYCAALAAAIVNGLDQRNASQWACQAAALSVTRPGTIAAYPTADEVNQFIQQNQMEKSTKAN